MAELTRRAGPDAATVTRRWLVLTAELVARHAEELTALDAAIGDGDHGINLKRGFAVVVERLGQADGVETDTATVILRAAGQALVGTVGGAAGPLYGTLLLELAGGLEGATTLEPEPFGGAFGGAVAAVARRGRSTAGEKTMLDALVPAVGAWQAAAAAGGDLAACADAAHGAAVAGRQATEALVATKGRASYLGERSRGHVDPGASSSALLVGALAGAIAQVGRGEGASR